MKRKGVVLVVLLSGCASAQNGASVRSVKASVLRVHRLLGPTHALRQRD